VANQYPPEVKARAQAIYEAEGAIAAAEQVGVSVSTVRSWQREGGWKRNLPSAGEVQGAYTEQQQATASAIRIGWQVRKRALADEMGQAAQEALVLLRTRIASGTIYGIEQLARALDILTTRADAMSAGTGGAEHGAAMPRSESIARVRTIVEGIKDRQAAGQGQ
jgi:transposase-like protein